MIRTLPSKAINLDQPETLEPFFLKNHRYVFSSINQATCLL
ncbi:hypothetical protein SeseC_01024 [Streptococcus equi subsp. zooepidemicus ATCC 35246]|nr:hypothetical protein SeseC_01024 [Streptococcus equi subsp. zooepidemicus ATCC 35246]AIA68757.1 hypothetical protein Q426_05380 [Streptococcus equi subsp. zooepidemicus CY]